MSTSVLDRLQDFTDRSDPPRRAAAESRVPEINQRTIYWGAGLVGAAIILMILIRLIGGSSFAGDVLSLGGIGVLFCGFLFCVSALGAWYYNKRKKSQTSTQPAWVAAAIVDRQIDASSDNARIFLFLELMDGRRVRVEPLSEAGRQAVSGTVGWASYRDNKLIDFIAE